MTTPLDEFAEAAARLTEVAGFKHVGVGLVYTKDRRLLRLKAVLMRAPLPREEPLRAGPINAQRFSRPIEELPLWLEHLAMGQFTWGTREVVFQFEPPPGQQLFWQYGRQYGSDLPEWSASSGPSIGAWTLGEQIKNLAGVGAEEADHLVREGSKKKLFRFNRLLRYYVGDGDGRVENLSSIELLVPWPLIRASVAREAGLGRAIEIEGITRPRPESHRLMVDLQAMSPLDTSLLGLNVEYSSGDDEQLDATWRRHGKSGDAYCTYRAQLDLTRPRPQLVHVFLRDYADVSCDAHVSDNVAEPATFGHAADDYSSSSAPAPLPPHPVVLSTLQLRDVRGIADLKVEFDKPTSVEEGQWIVFLGPNGAGKTTLLRALALALRKYDDPKIWPKGAFEPAWRTVTLPQTSISSIYVTTLAGSYRMAITGNAAEQFEQHHKVAFTHPIFAYGCRRGSAFDEHFGDGGPEVASLFDPGAKLVEAERWLRKLALARKSDGRGPYADAFEPVVDALKNLWKLDALESLGGSFFASGREVGRNVPLAALSDGYVTMGGWFVDLIARWIEMAIARDMPIKPSLLAEMTGLVLIDEIDMHIHPRWQIDVIPRIKKLLPKMSFVATTHNPLTLVGASPESIWILSKEEGTVRAERGREPPMLLTGGQILSRYFGIEDTLAPELRDKLRRHGAIASNPLRTDEDEADFEALEKDLREHGIVPGWETVPRTPERRSPGKKKSGKRAR